jgi:hypothetical protein
MQGTGRYSNRWRSILNRKTERQSPELFVVHLTRGWILLTQGADRFLLTRFAQSAMAAKASINESMRFITEDDNPIEIAQG